MGTRIPKTTKASLRKVASSKPFASRVDERDATADALAESVWGGCFKMFQEMRKFHEIPTGCVSLHPSAGSAAL
jgi:hypothetical protein